MARRSRDAGRSPTGGAYAPVAAGNRRARPCPTCGALPQYSCTSLRFGGKIFREPEITDGGYVKVMKGYHRERSKQREAVKES